MKPPIRRRRVISELLIVRGLFHIALLILRAVYIVIQYAVQCGNNNNDSAPLYIRNDEITPAATNAPELEPSSLPAPEPARCARPDARPSASCGRTASSSTPSESLCTLPGPRPEDATAERMRRKLGELRDPGAAGAHFWFYAPTGAYAAMLCARQLVLLGSLGTVETRSARRLRLRLPVEGEKWVRISAHFIPDEDSRMPESSTLVVLKVRRPLRSRIFRRGARGDISLAGKRYVIEVLHFLRDALIDGFEVHG